MIFLCRIGKIRGHSRVCPLILVSTIVHRYQYVMSLTKTRNPNPSPTGKKFGFLMFGGGRWIRTTEAISSRFTVCPLWPLGNSPISWCLLCGAGRRTRTPDLLITNQLLYQLSYTGRCSAHVRLLYYIMNPENVKRAFLQIVHCLIPFYIVLLFLVIL